MFKISDVLHHRHSKSSLTNTLTLKTTEWSFDTFVDHEVKGMPLKVKLGNSIKGDKDFDKVASWFNPQLSFISQ